MPNSKKTNKTGNILVIVMLVLIAAGLLIASRFIHSPNANLSQTEIEDSIRAHRLRLQRLSWFKPVPPPSLKPHQILRNSRRSNLLPGICSSFWRDASGALKPWAKNATSRWIRGMAL